jgi:hypothetical protein
MKNKYKKKQKTKKRHSLICPCNEDIKTQTRLFSGLMTKIGKGNTQIRKKVISSSDPCFIRYLSRCAHGVLSSNIQLPKKNYSILRGSKKLLLKLANKSHSISSKRKVLQEQVGSGFFSLLAGIAASVIGSLINKAI